MAKQELSSYKKNLKFVFKTTFFVVLLAFISSFNLVSTENIIESELISLALAFMFMFAIPVFFLKKIKKREISSFGLKLPKKIKEAVFYSVIAFLVLFPTVFIFGKAQLFHSFYTSKGLSVENFIIVAVVIPFFYFFRKDRRSCFLGYFNYFCCSSRYPADSGNYFFLFCRPAVLFSFL